ncbi:ATP-binding cassette domain-containing protein [Pedobacter sp. Hv1]|uniref:ATP-binding cassette domain-containing protein n=1 Tax=Pedobacter sp. Hv1 TaxID=1740090 RepID=UPI0006D8CCAA|nr:ATP-binding cassette domain-containing protein [Pedobacter sp. Hv1]KQC02828.1 molybdenum ABC transporter ATP-binding protein [Pedobacter sp. Hv1]
MSNVSVNIHHLNLNYQQKLVLRDLDWTINRGENWVLSGASGSGKTTLAKVIAGLQSAIGEVTINFDTESKLPAQTLYVESWYQFKNLEGVANFYYQQRYTSQQAKETLTVYAELVHYGKANHIDINEVEDLLTALDFAPFKNSQLIELSSGEHKKLQLIKALWLRPQLLIIDQPYTGLDVRSRQNLNILLDEIAAQGVQLILIGNDTALPSSIHRYAVITEGKLNEVDMLSQTIATEKITATVPNFLSTSPIYTSTQIVKMVDVNISYGEKQVLKNINWEVKAGEKWLLQGHNGSGKSTLLSLVNGDHPQSYANTLYLFGQKRGSGESIWDIKQHIGLISPEFHWYFDASSTVWQSIASGFFDSVGLFCELGYEKNNQVNELIEYFGLTASKNELLNTLPLGKQRLVLLARTIIKNPELLILDEPCQGLDQQQTQHFNQLVDELCNNGMTLIYVGHFEAQLPSCLTHQLQLHQGEVVSYDKTYRTQKELA